MCSNIPVDFTSAGGKPSKGILAPHPCENMNAGDDMSTISKFDRIEIVGGKAATSVNEPMTKSVPVTFGDANDSYRPKAIPDVGLVLLDEFIGMQKKLLAIKQEIWSLSKEIIGHHWEVQLQSLLDEGKLILDNGRFNFKVVNCRPDSPEALRLRAQSKLTELTKLLNNLVAFADVLKDSNFEPQFFGKLHLPCKQEVSSITKGLSTGRCCNEAFAILASSEPNVPVSRYDVSRLNRDCEGSLAAPWAVAQAGHSKEVSANSHTATTSISGCGGYSKFMNFAPESWSASVGRHISRPDYLLDVNSRFSFHDRPDYSGMGVYSSNVGNGHGTFSTPFKGVMPGQSFGIAIEKFPGDIMNYLEFKRKFAKYVENVYRDCDASLTYLESL